MIGIFDSGIGGVTIFKEILKILPTYGDKSRDEIYAIVKNIVEILISKGCEIIVIACNTASTQCVKKLREEFPNMTFIATEPAYKMVHDYAIDGKTLVMATKGTIASERFLYLYHAYDNGKTTILACPGLADLIEQGRNDLLLAYFDEHFSAFKDVDNIVLGCTHYPLIKKELKDFFGDVKFFDSALGVSKELKRKVELKKILPTKRRIEFYDSSCDQLKEERFYKFLQK